MEKALQPTRYNDVNEVLRDFVACIQALLGGQENHFYGLYLYGSLALGDFDPGHSDIDFIVVTTSELSAERIAALREMHARFANSSSPWAKRIEVAYIPREALNHLAPTEARYPQLEKGGELNMDHLEIGWIFQLYTLREYGVSVVGPSLRALIAPIDPTAMRRAVIAIPQMWLDDKEHDPTWLPWLRERENQAFVVLTLCRLLYTLGTADVASKPAAAHWCQQTLGEPWSALIGDAPTNQHRSGLISADEEAATIGLLQYTYERYWLWSSQAGTTRDK
ncbi:DUF4111 domain-containing protein [Ktedonosporobacter rubrisoli]|uniref:DUF4111 domain-containing protein n=1 Tax=Ktedonosporobacter rubrisoli TaxID=2509675 RepID=A0A4P6JLS9_KTERU|nr:aminoglycoside adenylyltransferase domain-containing protein [Ktedonosporobacter rubrisoli]QBD75616.1 DUF4111 domain-containing protein [Ktedonosporobacter rubrisoli]